MHPAAAAALATLLAAVPAYAQLTGVIDAHDPSTIVKEGSTYSYYATGHNLVSRRSTDLVNWTAGPSPFAATPSWVASAVPTGFNGDLWAPDVVYRNNQYYLYYSASAFGKQTSGIGVAVSPTLNPSAANYGFVDKGPVITSQAGSPYNAIDPSILNDTNGRMWMTFGSYWTGIYATELNPTTGLRLNSSVAPTHIAQRTGSDTSIEASALIQHAGYYYLFVNYGSCCSGIDSTYDIRVGRSTSPTGPFIDQNGVNMNNGGGSLFLDDDGAKIGPGHFALLNDNGVEKFSYHYYDGNRDGAPALGINNLYWTPDAWPSAGTVTAGWTGTASANWSDTFNWTNGQSPNGIGQIANFNTTGRRTLNVDANRSLSRMNFSTSLGYDLSSSNGSTISMAAQPGDAAATINVSAGSHAVRVPLAITGDLGVNVILDTSTLTLGGNVTGRSISKYGYGIVALGGTDALTGGIYVRNGGVIIDGNVHTTAFTSIGMNAGDVGTLTVRNVASLTSDADLNIGDNGNNNTAANGTLTLRDLANITVGTGGGLFIGSGFSAGVKASGTVNQTGGTLTANGNFDGAFVIGGRGSVNGVGVYNLSDGTVNANTNLFVGGRGTGTINQTGGTFNATKYVSVGRYLGATGAWTVANGTVNQTGTTAAFIVGEAGTGTLTINVGGVVNASGGVRLGLTGTGSSGTVIVNTGGRLATTSISRGAGKGALNINGGTLRAMADSADFVQLAPTEVEVLAGGATIDTNGHAVTLARPLDGNGRFSKTGSGTLTLGVVQNTRGGISVDAGTLAAKQITNNGDLAITGGSVQLLTPSTAFDPAQRSTVTGLSIAAGTSLDLSTNLFVVDYNPASASPVAQLALVAAEIADGRIRSTLTASQAIGYADSATLGTIPTAFGTVDASSILLRVTLRGDVTLDGSVGFADLVTLAQNYNTTGRFWANGDFNGDSAVNFADLVALAQNYNTTLSNAQTATLAAEAGASFAADYALARSLVPEPATLSALAAAGLIVAHRRR